MARHVAVVGVGLIGGSIARGLRDAGHHVVAFDRDEDQLTAAVERGVADRAAPSLDEACADADCAFIALPVGAISDAAVAALDAGAAVVSDVGSVKGPIVKSVADARPGAAARFVGGHPMAGSEQDGLDGARGDLFGSATWVLTPVEDTDAGAFATVRSLVGSLGAEVIAMEPAHHDDVVAVVSHVPHLAAGTLMLLAAEETAGERAAFLKLAAGGFRDMTRISAGHPGIWPDICVANQEAILAALDRYVEELQAMRSAVAAGDRDRLLGTLESARSARTNLPIAGATEGPLVEVRVPVPDRPGVLAEVTTLAGQLGVNIVDLEIAHSVEGPQGLLQMVVPASRADEFERGLADLGYHSSQRSLE